MPKKRTSLDVLNLDPNAIQGEVVPEAVEAELDSDGKAEADSVSEIALENPFPLGCRVSHAFFGSGTVRESHPKDEHWRLEVEFEDGSQRPLLSSFVKLLDEGGEVMPDAPQVVEADPVPESEAIEAEPVISEPEATEELEEEPAIDVELAVIEPERAEEPEVESMISEPGPIEVVVEVAEPIESEPVEVQPAVVEAAHDKGVPVIVDGAAQDHRMRQLIDTGADLFITSAHKYLCSTTAGIVAGRRELVEAVYLQNRGIGRVPPAPQILQKGRIHYPHPFSSQAD